MKTLPSLVQALLSLILLVSISPQAMSQNNNPEPKDKMTNISKPTMPNMANIMSAYKVNYLDAESKLDPFNGTLFEIPWAVSSHHAETEGDDLLIDTPGEFTTAIHFSPEIKGLDAATVINNGTTGSKAQDRKLAALRICAHWLKRYYASRYVEDLSYRAFDVEKPGDINNFKRVIDEISEDAGLTAQEVQDFYVTAVSAELKKLGHGQLTEWGVYKFVKPSRESRKVFFEEFIAPIRRYFVNSTVDNYLDLAKHYAAIISAALKSSSKNWQVALARALIGTLDAFCSDEFTWQLSVDSVHPDKNPLLVEAKSDADAEWLVSAVDK